MKTTESGAIKCITGYIIRRLNECTAERAIKNLIQSHTKAVGLVV